MLSNIVPWPVSVTADDIRSKLGADKLDNADVFTLVQIIHAMDAPASLRGIIPALSNFYQFLPSVINYSDRDTKDVFSDLESEIGTILNQLEGVQKKEDLLLRSHQSFCGTHPLYAVLLRFNQFRLPDEIGNDFVALFYLSFLSCWKQMSVSLRESSGLALRSTSEGKRFPNVKVFESFYHSLDLSDKKSCANSLDTFHSNLLLQTGDDESNLPAAAQHYIRTLALLFTGEIGKKKVSVKPTPSTSGRFPCQNSLR